MLRKLAIVFSLILLIVIGLLRASPGDEAAIGAYHRSAAEAVNSIPVDIDGWVGQQVPLPQSATNLLRPNALIARSYSNPERGVSATLMIVQCRDTRDMTGHYPPRCYPANGWLEPEQDPVGMVNVEGQEMRSYRFHRVAGRVERDITVYSLFVLPTGEKTVSMVDVRKLSADYRYRRYGAAQIQVVIDGSVSPDDHGWILEEMYEIARPAIEAVLGERAPVADREGSV